MFQNMDGIRRSDSVHSFEAVYGVYLIMDTLKCMKYAALLALVHPFEAVYGAFVMLCLPSCVFLGGAWNSEDMQSTCSYGV